MLSKTNIQVHLLVNVRLLHVMVIDIRNDELYSCINKSLVHHKLNVAHFEAHVYPFLQAKLEGSTTPSQTRLANPIRNDSLSRDDLVP
jgi:hypothetical protein